MNGTRTHRDGPPPGDPLCRDDTPRLQHRGGWRATRCGPWRIAWN